MDDKKFLFSIDLEDVRDMIKNGYDYSPGLPRTIPQYLDLLRRYNFKCTVFTVGSLAKRHPEILKLFLDEGHEIACHSDQHFSLTTMNEKTFAADLSENIKALKSCGATRIQGFRAPTLSLTKNTAWAYKIMHDHGLSYSSSVLPANNPLFGWKEFGLEPKLIDGIIEIPVTISKKFPLKWPFGAGTYFRLLPFFITKRLFLEASENHLPVIGYFHPYDIDVDQEFFMHPNLNDSKLMNKLMYIKRNQVLKRLEKLFNEGYIVEPYADYIKSKNFSF